MPKAVFQQLRVYQYAEQLSDVVWGVVKGWSHFERDTIGKQLVRAVDSIGANIAEGYGRGSHQDNRRFVKIARGSLNETLHFLRRAHCRGLLTDEHREAVKALTDNIGPMLNGYLKSIGRSSLPTNDKLPTTNESR